MSNRLLIVTPAEGEWLRQAFRGDTVSSRILDRDVRCSTCRHWLSEETCFGWGEDHECGMAKEFDSSFGVDADGGGYAFITAPDHACSRWEQRV